MKKSNILLLAAAISFALTSCGHNHENDELAHHHHHGHESEHQHKPAHNHEHEGEDHDEDEAEEHAHNEISLDPEMAERFGVETETAARRQFNDVLKVSGVVSSSSSETAVIVAPVSGTITFIKGIETGSKVGKGNSIASINSSAVAGGNQNLAAKANYEAAKRELDRLKPLYDDKLVTASDYNAALRAYEEAKANYSAGATSGIVSSPISGTIVSLDAVQGQFVEAGSPVAVVSASNTLTLRADVPQKYYNRLNGFTDAAIAAPYSDNITLLSTLGGKRINGSDQLASVSKGYIPVYFSFINDGSFVPGTNVEVFLRGKAVDDVISVPLTALSEQQGLFYVFIRLDEDCYRKSLVKTGRNDGERIEILSGVNEGEDVVVKGTTTVRIAESSGVVPEGHTHNH